jgi:superfamily II DNA or RNA helicase
MIKSDTLRINLDSSRGNIEFCSEELAKELNTLCSYRVNGYQYSDLYLNGFWDGFVRRFSLKTKTFPAGLVGRIINYLDDKKISYNLFDSRKKASWSKEEVIKNIKEFSLILRPYQLKAVVKGLNNPYMIFWHATSAGKTVIFCALIKALSNVGNYKKTLILVSNKDLSAQHRDELGSMLDTKIGLIEEGRFEPEQISVAVINTLWNKAINKKNKDVINYLKSIDHLILDEAHRAIDSKMFKNTIKLCKNTSMRHGFSASPYSLTTDDLELECLTGQPLSRVSLSSLIKEGWVSRPEINIIKYESPTVPYGAYNSIYKKGITDNERRNQIISEIVLDEFNKGKQILVLVRTIKHGIILRDLFLESGIPKEVLAYIHGSTDPYIRKETKKNFKKKLLNVVIASQIWNEGIDIPSINVLIKADAGGAQETEGEKGLRSVIQQIGRSVRKEIKIDKKDVDPDEESIVSVYDFFDSCNRILNSHSLNRYDTYSLEKEFVIKFLRK